MKSRFVLAAAVGCAVALGAVRGFASEVNYIANGDFEAAAIFDNGGAWGYYAPGKNECPGWTNAVGKSGGWGFTKAGQPWTSQSDLPIGTYAAFVQGNNFMRQTFTVDHAGIYKFSFVSTRRVQTTSGHLLKVSFDGIERMSVTSDNNNYRENTCLVRLAEGEHELLFTGVQSTGDQSTVIDNVSLVMGGVDDTAKVVSIRPTGLRKNVFVENGMNPPLKLAGFPLDDFFVLGGDVEKSAIGKYTVTVSLPEGYTWDDGTTDSLSFDWRIVGAFVKVPEIRDSELLATGREIYMDTMLTHIDRVVLGGDLTVSEPGSYALTVMPAAGDVWEDGTDAPIAYPFNVRTEYPANYTGGSFLKMLREHPLRVYNAPAQGGDVILRLPVAGRNDIYEYVHVFTNAAEQTEYFVLTEDVAARVLAVGGGGAGGCGAGTGGGGAGGMVETNLALAAGTYVAQVGAGGTCAYAWYVTPQGGADTLFAALAEDGFEIVAYGGGGGGTQWGQTGGAGGSGGGGWRGEGGTYKALGQGFSGVSSGGGAGGCGCKEANYYGGAGGPGRTSDITGEPIFYAGGGAGGSTAYPNSYSGGRGGGGNSVCRGASTAGADGLGGGVGEQNGGNRDGGSGGSGVVIVRYASSLMAFSVETPVPVQNLVWNGEEQTGVRPGDGYAIEGNVATDAGTYTATLTLLDGYTWLDGGTAEPRTVEWTIAPQRIAVPGIKLSDIVVTGEAVAPPITSDEYVVRSYDAEPVEPGVYTLTLTPDANHAWTDGTAAPVAYPFRVISEAGADYSGNGFLAALAANELRVNRAPAEGGDVIIRLPIAGTDEAYEYIHVFSNATEAATFTLAENVTARVLMVGGGGAGGFGSGSGGGGAGGFVETNIAMAAGTYTVTVGAGGTSPVWAEVGNGGDSVLAYGGGADVVRAIGGGGAGSESAKNGKSGGSGGGRYDNNSGVYAAGKGVPGQGYDGDCGGGGAGGVGERNPSTCGGTGGNGRTSDITGDLVWYAGGGAGGSPWHPYSHAGGKGGGGNSPNRTVPTGGGGGQPEQNGGRSAGGAGGSGIVIIRYTSSMLAFKADIPSVLTGFVYDGNAKTGVLANVGYDIVGNVATNAGVHTATLTLWDRYKWVDGTEEPIELEWSIARLPIDTPAPLRSDLVVTGDVLVPALNSEVGVVQGGDLDATELGAYALTVTPDANHCWKDGGLTTFEYAFRIIPEEPTDYAGTGFIDFIANHPNRIASAPYEGGDYILKLPHEDDETVFEYIHVFTTPGEASFKPDEAASVRVLMVGGGGAGGFGSGSGGGGAGGFVETNVAMAACTYTVTVGAGGTCPVWSAAGNGGDTSLALGLEEIARAIGGGGAGSESAKDGKSGGSGGGRFDNNSGVYAAGKGVLGQGYAGVCGGGGAGGIGERNPSTCGGNGGCGRASDILGSYVWFAGGGAGGSPWHPHSHTGGKGGGGDAYNRTMPKNGATGLGGGGAGQPDQNGGRSEGGSGGSGIVIFRYTSDRVVKQKAKLPEVYGGLVWNGHGQKGVEIGAGYVIEGNTATTAGTYTATATLVDEYEWEDGTVEPKLIEWTIARAPVDVPQIGTTDFIATGAEITPVFSSLAYLEKDGDVSAVDPGEYTVTLRPDTNHVWTTGSLDPVSYGYRLAEGAESVDVGRDFLGYLRENAKIVDPADVPCQGGDLIFEIGSGVRRRCVHVFTNTQKRLTFTVGKHNVKARILAIGGGGGGGQGGNSSGGGGGAGGMVEIDELKLSRNVVYKVAVGAGGASSESGSPTTLMRDATTLVEALGGGAGGHDSGGRDGGCGGGGTAGGMPGAGSQGCCGGLSLNGGGGGGGAGGVGGNSTYNGQNTGAAGAGGYGKASDITGEVIYYAGGGAGAANGGMSGAAVGGKGGGGTSRGRDSYGENGVDGLGAGGAGGANGSNGARQPGGNGGTGILIIRYNPKPLGTAVILR